MGNPRVEVEHAELLATAPAKAVHGGCEQDHGVPEPQATRVTSAGHAAVLGQHIAPRDPGHPGGLAVSAAPEQSADGQGSHPGKVVSRSRGRTTRIMGSSASRQES